MLNQNLFETVLVDPARSGANQLFIVSGYATPGIASTQLDVLQKEIGTPIEIHLIVGMTALDGIARAHHEQFKRLQSDKPQGEFQCNYLVVPPQVHSKTYAWCQDGKPVKGFVGSANYTNSGLFRHREAMSVDDALECFGYYQSLLGASISCLHPDAGQLVTFNDDIARRAREIGRESPVTSLRRGLSDRELGAQPVKLSLLERAGIVGGKSDLNWGQRPRREPNQAYIGVPAKIRRYGFFPQSGRHFTIQTDDGKSFDAVIAQQGDKAIETPTNNSELGRYFRKRLGLADGAPVGLEDLKRYGRTDVDFVRIDDDTYYMDFSVRRG